MPELEFNADAFERDAKRIAYATVSNDVKRLALQNLALLVVIKELSARLDVLEAEPPNDEEASRCDSLMITIHEFFARRGVTLKASLRPTDSPVFPLDRRKWIVVAVADAIPKSETTMNPPAGRTGDDWHLIDTHATEGRFGASVIGIWAVRKRAARNETKGDR